MAIATLHPSEVRRVLWAEDEPDDIEGTPAYLEFIGHEIVWALDFESTASALTDEKFDLLVIDQRMPRGGRRIDDAGAELVLMLQAGELGPTNADIPFVFVTASEEFVIGRGTAVDHLPGYVDIIEKGDDLTTPLEDCLRKIPRRCPVHKPVPELGTPADGGTSEDPPSSIDKAELSEKWHGVVVDIHDNAFRARLSAARGPLPDYEVTLPMSAVSERDLDKIVEGSTFTWTLDVEDDEDGQRLTRSRLEFRAAPEILQSEIDAALARAREKRSSGAENA